MIKSNVKIASFGQTERHVRDLIPSGEGKAGPRAEARERLKGRLALAVPEVADLLGISTAAVRLMIARGDLPGRKIGGGIERVTYIVPTGALLSWLEGTEMPLRPTPSPSRE